MEGKEKRKVATDNVVKHKESLLYKDVNKTASKSEIGPILVNGL